MARMSEYSKTIALLLLLCLFFVSYLARPYRRGRALPLPPGPKGLPLIGNAHQIPSINPWRTYKTWHGQYGPIITVRRGAEITIILGSYSAAQALLNKRSSIYSSRPRMVVVGDHVYGGRMTSLLPYGARWRVQHRVQASFLNIRMARKYHNIQDTESRQLVHELLSSSSDFAAIFYRYSSSLIFTLAYGKRIAHGDQQELKAFADLVEEVLQEVDGNFIVDSFPILDHLPRCIAPWKERGRRLYRKQAVLFQKFMAEASKTGSWNWTKAAFRLADVLHVDKEELSFIIGVLIEAAHTTPMVLEVFVMASILHQDAVLRAQRELDVVVGLDRLPAVEDLPRLPYVNAFVREVFRWRPITPGGMVHATIEEDEYMGYRIPKGATVVANHWSLDLDGDLFEHPHEFKPERWIENPNLPESAFGFGRRVCPGQHLGRSSVLLIVARILWAYDMDYHYENGERQDIDPWDMTQGPDSRPSPFKAAFRVRSSGHQEVIEKEWRRAEKDVDVLLDQAASL